MRNEAEIRQGIKELQNLYMYCKAHLDDAQERSFLGHIDALYWVLGEDMPDSFEETK